MALRSLTIEKPDSIEEPALTFMPAFKMDHHLLVVNQVSLLGLAPSLDAMGVGRKLL